MDSAQNPQKKPTIKLVFLFLLFYGLMHLAPALSINIGSTSFTLFGPQIVLAEEDDEEEEEDEDEDEDEDQEGEESEDGEEGAEGEGEPEEDDMSYLYDIGPAKDIQNEQFVFPGLGNRKATWMAAQLHILFASFILGCPMFVVIMEVMGARRTQ